jgi:hypothetical protein
MGLFKLKYVVSAVFLAVNLYSSFAQVKITDGAVLTLNPNSLLELESTNKGLLIPHMAIKNLSLPAPLTAPVPIGMQVYDTSYLTPNGFYYWTGTNWKIYSSPAIPVRKSVNTTLLKTETVVLASGNNTFLTLPAVTSADSGLEITIKNVGTYTDLISVVAQAGKLMDNTDTSRLTRWVGRTYIASGSNWIVKNKETRPDNQYEVSALGSFKTVAEVIAFLNAHMFGPSLIKMGGAQNYPIAATQTINLPYPLTIEGLSYGESHLYATSGVSGNPMFICQTECYFKMLVFVAYSNAAGNDAIHFTGTSKYHEVKDCDFSGFNKGLQLTNNCAVWFFENTFEDCAVDAIEIAAGAAIGGILEMADNDFTRCKTGVNLISGVNEIVSITSNNFYNTTAGTDTAFRYKPSTFTTFISLGFTNNFWNNQGGFIAGFDFTRADGRDAGALIENNAGMQNQNPHCKINVANNGSQTFITTALTFYKAIWITNSSVYTCKWTLGSTVPTSGNRVTYQPTNSRDAWAIVTGDLLVDGSNRVLTYCIVKNGVTTTRYGETDVRTFNISTACTFATVIYIPALVKNDYLEVWVTSDHAGDNITLVDVQWFTNTQ